MNVAGSFATMRAQAEFAIRFAWRDITPSESRRELICAIAIASGLIGLYVWGVTFVEGAIQAKREQSRRDGENRCVRGGSRTVENAVTDKLEKTVANNVRRELEELGVPAVDASGEPAFEISSYFETNRLFRNLEVPGYSSQVGRTFTLDDPILRFRPPRNWNGERVDVGEDRFGIYASSELIDSLSGEVDGKSPTIWGKADPSVVISEVGVDFPVPVLGMVEDLPEAYTFVCSERTYRKLTEIRERLDEPRKTFDMAMPEKWSKKRLGEMSESEKENSSGVATPPPKVIEWARQNGIQIKPKRDFNTGETSWELLSFNSAGSRRANFVVVALELGSTLGCKDEISKCVWKELGIGDADETMDGEVVVAADGTRPPRNFMCVYAAKHEWLTNVALAMNDPKLDLKPNTEYARQRKEIASQAEQLIRTFKFSFYFSLVIGIVGLFASESLRAQIRKAEIGMLRAIGMPNRVWNQICFLEAFFLAATGGVLIGVLTIPVGLWLAPLVAPSPDLASFSFPWLSSGYWLRLMQAVLGVATLNVVVLLVANRSARQGDPAELVRL